MNTGNQPVDTEVVGAGTIPDKAAEPPKDNLPPSFSKLMLEVGSLHQRIAPDLLVHNLGHEYLPPQPTQDRLLAYFFRSVNENPYPLFKEEHKDMPPTVLLSISALCLGLQPGTDRDNICRLLSDRAYQLLIGCVSQCLFHPEFGRALLILAIDALRRGMGFKAQNLLSWTKTSCLLHQKRYPGDLNNCRVLWNCYMIGRLEGYVMVLPETLYCSLQAKSNDIHAKVVLLWDQVLGLLRPGWAKDPDPTLESVRSEARAMSPSIPRKEDAALAMPSKGIAGFHRSSFATFLLWSICMLHIERLDSPNAEFAGEAETAVALEIASLLSSTDFAPSALLAYGAFVAALTLRRVNVNSPFRYEARRLTLPTRGVLLAMKKGWWAIVGPLLDDLFKFSAQCDSAGAAPLPPSFSRGEWGPELCIAPGGPRAGP